LAKGNRRIWRFDLFADKDMKPIRLIVLLALLAPPLLAQQPPGTPGTLGTPGTRTLRGVVVSANDTPMARVRVAAVTGSATSEPAVLTDERGEFAVGVPGTERARLIFTEARYAAVTIDLPPGDRKALAASGLRVRMSLAGAISGQVRDRAGEPVLQAAVTMRRLASGPHQRRSSEA
jgi:hypothetical protein